MFVRVVGGFLQAAAGVGVAVWRLGGDRVVGVGGDEAQMFVHGFAHFVAFLVGTAWGWVAMWLFAEGLLRVLAAAMQQEFSTLPVVVARAAWAWRPRVKALEDAVARDGDALVIDSAREYDWHALTTVDVDGALHQVARERGTPERPYRYRLTPIAPDHVVRTVTRYPPPTGGRAG